MTATTYFNLPHFTDMESYQLLDQYLFKTLTFMESSLLINYKNYDNIFELLENHSPSTQTQLSILKWIKESVLPSLQLVKSSLLPNTDPFLDILDHRLYVLELDIQSKIPDNVLVSISATLEEIIKYSP